MHLHLITVNRENVFNHEQMFFYGIVCIFKHQTQPVGMNVWDRNMLRRTLQNGSVVRRGETDHRLNIDKISGEIEKSKIFNGARLGSILVGTDHLCCS